MKSLLIIKVGDALPEARERGADFETWIARGFGPFASDAQVADARRDQPLPPLEALAGVVVTGSAAMVTDRAPWSEALVPWLRQAVEHDLPVLGICYGHQLLAHAFGGEVDFHPQGMEIGTVQLCKTEHAGDDPLFDALPAQFRAQAVHSQSVRRLPPGAICLAGNEHESHHAYRIGGHAWGVQFHPEFDAEAMQGYLRKFGPELAARGREPERIAEAIAPTPDAAAILKRFAHYAHSRGD